MKNLISIFFLLATGLSNTMAQIVNIPDANFRNALINKLCVDDNPNHCGCDNDVDSNNNGQIELSEARAVISLDVSGSNIADLTGIRSFGNLEFLICNNNQLATLNLQGMTKLKTLCYAVNHITNLNGADVPNLQILDCSSNGLTSLNLQGLSNLYNLVCEHNLLTNINLQAMPNLYGLICNNNQLTNINVQQAPKLESLVCNYNALTNLNVQGLTKLKTLSCTNNQITNLDLHGLTILEQLFCDENQITSLEVQESTNLWDLRCAYNQITKIEVQNLANLQYLYCNDNPLSCISFLPQNLYHLSLSNTNITCLPNIPANIATTLPLCTSSHSNPCAFTSIEARTDLPNVKISPNPMHDQAQIEISINDAEKILNFSLYNMLGQVLQQQVFVGNTITVMRNDLPQGIYFYTVQEKNNIITKGKLEIQ